MCCVPGVACAHFCAILPSHSRGEPEQAPHDQYYGESAVPMYVRIHHPCVLHVRIRLMTRVQVKVIDKVFTLNNTNRPCVEGGRGRCMMALNISTAVESDCH